MCRVELVPEASVRMFVMLVKMSAEFVGLLTGTSAVRGGRI
jgi:hypothetical protein